MNHLYSIGKPTVAAMEPVYEYKLFGQTICRFVKLGEFYDDYCFGNKMTAILPLIEDSKVEYMFNDIGKHTQIVDYIDPATVFPMLYRAIRDSELYIMNQQDLRIDATRVASEFYYYNLLPRVAEAIRKHHATRIITRYFRKAISDPNYIYCRRRLLREFEEFCK